MKHTHFWFYLANPFFCSKHKTTYYDLKILKNGKSQKHIRTINSHDHNFSDNFSDNFSNSFRDNFSNNGGSNFKGNKNEHKKEEKEGGNEKSIGNNSDENDSNGKINIFAKHRNDEYENILDEILSEYEDEANKERNKQSVNRNKRENEKERKSKNKNKRENEDKYDEDEYDENEDEIKKLNTLKEEAEDEVTKSLNEKNKNGTSNNKTSNEEIEEEEEEEEEKKKAKRRNEEIKKHQLRKENNLLNLCNLNYDILNLILNDKMKRKEDKKEDVEGNYNQFSVFMESKSHKEMEDGLKQEFKELKEKYENDTPPKLEEITEQASKERTEELTDEVTQETADFLPRTDEIKNQQFCVDDSIGRYLFPLDDDILNSVSEKETHFLKNEINKHIIFLKYTYLKQYKNSMHQLKQQREKKTQEINKHVSIVHEDEHDDEYENEHKNEPKNEQKEEEIKEEKESEVEKEYLFDSNGKDKISVSNNDNNSEDNSEDIQNIEDINSKLSMDHIEQLTDVNTKITYLQKNFDFLKNLNIFTILNNNIFLKNLKQNNLSFVNFDSITLDHKMNEFLRNVLKEKKKNQNEKVTKKEKEKEKEKRFDNSTGKQKREHIEKQEKLQKENIYTDNTTNGNTTSDTIDDADGSIENRYVYISVPKIRDSYFLKGFDTGIIVNVNNKKKLKRLQRINEINVKTDKGILVLSNHQKNMHINVQNICDKFSYLSQSIVLLSSLNLKQNEDFIRQKRTVIRLLILMVFYFNLKNIYIICLDQDSSTFFYNFLKDEKWNNLFHSFQKHNTTYNQTPSLFVSLKELTFSQVVNKNFVPLFNIYDIVKNCVFFMTDSDHKICDNKNNDNTICDDKNLFQQNLDFLKKSSLFIFLTKTNKHTNQVKSSQYAQHFLLSKKYYYPYIYDVDPDFSITTLKTFNEIMLYLTSWINFFQAGEYDAEEIEKKKSDESDETEEVNEKEEVEENGMENYMKNDIQNESENESENDMENENDESA